MEWIRRLFRKRNVPVFFCRICHRRIKDVERTAMLMDRITWKKSLVHKDCLPARMRPAVFNPALRG